MELPIQLLNSLEGLPGFDLQDFEKVHQLGGQVTSIRLNENKINAQFPWQDLLPVPWCSTGKYLAERPSFTLDPLFHAGAYYVQEASSMFIWQLLHTLFTREAPVKVLDLCAAPGGKSSLLASFFKEGLIVSNELIKSRAAILVENMTKWGAANTMVTNNDVAHFANLEGFFDLILVDAPCSGSGLFRKDPGAIEEWSMEAVNTCSGRQKRILGEIMPALKDGGLLIYSTCSYSVEENEQMTDWLLASSKMESVPIPILPEWGIVETLSPNQKGYGYRFYPNHLRGEGFYLSALIKTETTSSPKYSKKTLSPLSKTELAQLQAFVPLDANSQLFKQGDLIRKFPMKWYESLRELSDQLYLKKAGLGLGEIKGKDFIPHHELAVSEKPSFHFQSIELGHEQALNYLRRKELAQEDFPLGWNLVSYLGLGLGWVKVLKNRINNYYPTEWRVLKE